MVAIDQLISPPANPAPERIRNWMNSQLSVARFYGGCTYQNSRYVIDYEADGNPLVRADVFAVEHRIKREAAKAAARAKVAADKLRADKQGALL